jgi:hypothetical protein
VSPRVWTLIGKQKYARDLFGAVGYGPGAAECAVNVRLNLAPECTDGWLIDIFDDDNARRLRGCKRIPPAGLLFYRKGIKAKRNGDVLSLYDPKSNEFGAYNRDGTIRTFMKPTSKKYFDDENMGHPTLSPAQAIY